MAGNWEENQAALYEVNGGKPFAFAGLWEQWWGPDHKAETPLESCIIITTDTNELTQTVHDRMPVKVHCIGLAWE